MRSTTLAVLIALSAVACSSRVIHPDISNHLEPSSLFTRQWTFRTMEFSARQAGDRGVEFSNPIGFENSMVFGTMQSGLVSMYPDTQAIRWKLDVPGGVSSELTRSDKTVFFGSTEGYLHAVDLERGKLLWKYPLRSAFISKPMVAGGKLFVTTSDDSVYAMDAGSGQLLWTYRRRSANPSSVLGASTPVLDQNQLLVGMSDGYLVSLTPEEGKLRWEKKLNEGRKFTDIDAQPVVQDQLVLVPAFDGYLYALKRESGDVVWKSESGGNRQVLVSGDQIFQASSDGWIFCLDRNSGKTLWKFELDVGVSTKLVMIDDQTVVFGSTSRYLYALNAKSGLLKFRFDVGHDSGFSGTPYFDPALKLLVILSKSGNLYSFRYQAPRT